MSDPSIPRRRGRPTRQEQAERQEQERIQSVLRRRQERARKILARTDVQELLTTGRQELGIPAGGFGSDEAGYMAWDEEALASKYAALEQDKDAQLAIGQALEAAGVPWPAHWSITSLHPTRELHLYDYVHTLKLVGELDDTWHGWATNVILRGEAEAAVTLPGTAERTPHFLWTGAAGQITRMAHRPAVDPNDRPQTSRPAIYVDDDLEPEDLPSVLASLRQRQHRPIRNEGTPHPLTRFAGAFRRHVAQGNTWRSWLDTPDGQRLIAEMGLQNLERETQSL